ncbi:hypothetical protein [Ruicaihuangia caeni]|uniref:DNA modification methylase n=1 Tax=Ruicaihuangia caeni TaxID=3042517 RepID=A0AAW6TBN6_9MICO|nr:hypothetical protein [Klugiella sp. YN-L-19]MDI2098745.1 hypothetical protein [Klugiella sp. YN-L-19]
MSHGATFKRAAASIAAAGVLAIGLSGCGFLTPQATTKNYSASDGVNGTVGDVRLLNILALSSDGTDLALVGSVYNDGDSAVTVRFQAVDAPAVTESVRVEPGQSVRLGIDETLVMSGVDAELGSIVPIYAQYGSKESGSELQVPLLDGSLPEYEAFLPESNS